MKTRQRQMDLFRGAPPATTLAPDQRSKLLPLIEALLKEVITGTAMATREVGDDDEDHA